MEMQHSNSNSVTEFHQLYQSWTTLLNRFYDDTKVAQLLDTRIWIYLSSHPFLAVTAVLFSVMAALPVGIFLSFALVTIIMSAVGFIFLEAFVLLVGVSVLLCVLSGIALFSVMASFIFHALYLTISTILSYYNLHLAKPGEVQETDTQCDTSKLKGMQ